MEKRLKPPKKKKEGNQQDGTRGATPPPIRPKPKDPAEKPKDK